MEFGENALLLFTQVHTLNLTHDCVRPVCDFIVAIFQMYPVVCANKEHWASFTNVFLTYVLKFAVNSS